MPGNPDDCQLIAPARSPSTCASAFASLLVGLGSFVIFGTLAVLVAKGRSLAIDTATLPSFDRAEQWPGLRKVVGLVGLSGGAAGTIAITAVTLLVLLWLRRPISAAFLVAAVSVSVLSPLLKDAFDRPPPPGTLWAPGDTGFFPSGHATGSMAVAATITALVWHTRYRTLALGAAVILVPTVGLSALWQGNHWPSDVVGGWALSLAWVCATCVAAAAWRRSRYGAAPPRLFDRPARPAKHREGAGHRSE